MSDPIKERRLRRVAIRAEYVLDWFRDVSMAAPGQSILWPVIEGIPAGYRVAYAYSEPACPPDIYVVIAHPSFDPVGYAPIPLMNGSVDGRYLAIPLTDGQAKLLRECGYDTTGRKPKLL